MAGQHVVEYLDVLATLRLACAQVGSSNKYISKVAKRVAARCEYKEGRMLCVGINMNKKPKEAVRRIHQEVEGLYKEHGIDWREVNAET